MKAKINELNARYLNLLTDFGFHKVFGTESNKDLLIDFLNQVIKEEGLITDIQYHPPKQWGNFRTDRKAIFDIFCTTENGEYFIVEMQRVKQVYFRDRSIYYASLPIQKQAPQGIWDFRLKAVYMVAIMNFVIFDEFEEDADHIIENVCLMRERTKTVFSNKLKFAFVELPKFRKTEEELETHFDIWMYLLKNLPKLDKRPASVKGKVFEKLFELAEIKQLTKKDMGRYRKSILEDSDFINMLDYARGEGIEKGREEGREEYLEKIIQKSIKMNIPIEIIVELTGYSEEQIIQYKMNNSQ